MENQERKQIKLVEVISMLENGNTREEIGVHYDLSKKEVGVLFKHPKLKGRRTQTKNVVSFDIVDEEEEVVAETPVNEVDAEPTNSETPELVLELEGEKETNNPFNSL